MNIKLRDQIIILWLRPVIPFMQLNYNWSDKAPCWVVVLYHLCTMDLPGLLIFQGCVPVY